MGIGGGRAGKGSDGLRRAGRGLTAFYKKQNFIIRLDLVSFNAIIFVMNSRQRKTLKTIFTTPIPKGILWEDIEALLLAAGAVCTEGRGSRVKFDLHGETASFHRPHPTKEALPYQVKDARTFLEQAGVKP